MLQLADTPSESLCVPMAHGGDPQFSFNVKMRGVEGTRWVQIKRFKSY